MPKKSATRSRSSHTSQSSKSQPRTGGLNIRTALWAAFGTALLVLVSYMMGWRLYQDAQSQLRLDKYTSISGVVQFTALMPGPDDNAEVKLYVRNMNESSWIDTGIMLPIEEEAAWSWHEALPAVNYEFEARLVVDGQEVDQTDTQPVTAPASNVVMALNYTWSEVADGVDRPDNEMFSGEVTVNGYIPNDSVLEIYSVPPGDEYDIEAFTPALLRQSQLLTSIRPVEPVNAWSWDEAEPETAYELIAVLRQRGQTIGTSVQYLTAEAGQRRLNFTLNSMASAPDSLSSTGDESQLALGSAGGRVLGTTTAGNSSISGTVFIQGPEQENTSLLMLWKNPSDANYQVINRYNYPPQLGTVYSWNGANAGQTYDIMAALQVNNNNTSTAPTPQVVTAPATGVNFTLNTWYVIPATPNTPVFQTCLNRSGNSWTAQLSLPPVQGAQQYWVQVGTNANTSNVWNQQFSAGANNQPFIIKVPAQENQQLFVQYAYATCDQCQGDDNFAPFSTNVSFTCL